MGHQDLLSLVPDRLQNERAERLCRQVDQVFPFSQCQDCGEYTIENGCPQCGSGDLERSYRQHQKEILMEAVVELFLKDKDIVIIDGPVGLGKSAINWTLGVIGGPAFYTTPQKSLRKQLANDDALDDFMHTLRARRDYVCGVTGENCEDCHINKSSDPEDSCVQEDHCTYWNNKEKAMSSMIAGLTFSYTIIDSYLPTLTDGGEQISFQDRNLMIVDECHKMAQQVASLHAGWSLSPWRLPEEVYRPIVGQIPSDADRYHHVDHLVQRVADRAEKFVRMNEGDERKETEIENCENFLRSYRYTESEIDEGRTWVVDVEKTDHPVFGSVNKAQIKPVRVDRFLRRFVWSRSDKIVLSSATIPYRGNPEEWLDRLGLGDDYHLISCPMPFDKDRRRIHTDTMIDKFSGGGDDENWNQIVDRTMSIADKHDGEKGLIHTASYQRAERLVESLPRGMAMTDERGEETDDVIRRWQRGSTQILCSPSMTEGVDLEDDICRWQIILKVPYPNSHVDSRVDYLLDEENDWDWYYQQTGLSLFQAYGRAMRSADDYQELYILDRSVLDVTNRVSTPTWFEEGIDAGHSWVPESYESLNSDRPKSLDDKFTPD